MTGLNMMKRWAIMPHLTPHKGGGYPSATSLGGALWTGLLTRLNGSGL